MHSNFHRRTVAFDRVKVNTSMAYSFYFFYLLINPLPSLKKRNLSLTPCRIISPLSGNSAEERAYPPSTTEPRSLTTSSFFPLLTAPKNVMPSFFPSPISPCQSPFRRAEPLGKAWYSTIPARNKMTTTARNTRTLPASGTAGFFDRLSTPPRSLPRSSPAVTKHPDE